MKKKIRESASLGSGLPRSQNNLEKLLNHIKIKDNCVERHIYITISKALIRVISSNIGASFWSLSSSKICRISFPPSSLTSPSILPEFSLILPSIILSKILSTNSNCLSISLSLPCRSNLDNMGIKSDMLGAPINSIILNSTSRNLSPI
ncbi:hypothetical protein Hanom_Chr04g00309751 [Helianthus anomalus]